MKLNLPWGCILITIDSEKGALVCAAKCGYSLHQVLRNSQVGVVFMNRKQKKKQQQSIPGLHSDVQV